MKTIEHYGQVTHTYEQQRFAILESYPPYVLADIIRKLEHCDPADALRYLECATSLYRKRLEEVKMASI